MDEAHKLRGYIRTAKAVKAYGVLGALKEKLAIVEARASVALDGETQSGWECECGHITNEKRSVCDDCGKERT